MTIKKQAEKLTMLNTIDAILLKVLCTNSASSITPRERTIQLPGDLVWYPHNRRRKGNNPRRKHTVTSAPKAHSPSKDISKTINIVSILFCNQ
jgi:hypothetical protein